MTCTVTVRQRVREAATALRSQESVVAVDVLSPSTGPRRGWSLEATTTAPPSTSMLQVFVEYGLTVPDISPRGPDVWFVVATGKESKGP